MKETKKKEAQFIAKVIRFSQQNKWLKSVPVIKKIYFNKLNRFSRSNNKITLKLIKS